MQPDEAVLRLGNVLEAQGTPLRELSLNNPREGHRAYGASTAVGRVWVAVLEGKWSVYFSPPGAQRFISLWDWEECKYGKPQPGNIELPLDESVDWVLGFLERRNSPEIDLVCVEAVIRRYDRRVARDRWLTPLLFLGGYVIAVGLFVSFLHSGLTMTGITSMTLLLSLLVATFKPVYLRIRRKFEGRQ
ncbi:MAG: hypothetical protein Q4D96_11965 [Propionibacteriaceae bacterium]|nr:hypothetical protein [Propionibacteriaceae bacterium]